MTVIAQERPTVTDSGRFMRVCAVNFTASQAKTWIRYRWLMRGCTFSAWLADGSGNVREIRLEPQAICRTDHTESGWVIKGRSIRSQLEVLLLWDFSREKGSAKITA